MARKQSETIVLNGRTVRRGPVAGRRRVLFVRTPVSPPASSSKDSVVNIAMMPEQRQQRQQQRYQPLGTASGTSLENVTGLSASLPLSSVPPLFTTLPPLCDFDPTNLSPSSRLSYKYSASFSSPSTQESSTSQIGTRSQLKTETVRAQNQTVAACLPFLSGTKDGLAPTFNQHGIPPLQWEAHVDFVRDSLEVKPSGFVGFDPARPFIVYWAITALATLYQFAPKKTEESEWDFEGRARENRALRNRALDTFHAQQNATGGFGGSHGYLSHLAPTYAAVLSLATLATLPDGKDTLSMVDRRGVWGWLGQLKQADGGVAVCEGGEIDVRAAYITMVLISLLNLPLDLPDDAPARQYGLNKFTDGMGEWLGRCQTYEGGISGAPDSEAHGAYAYCVLAALSLMGDPRDTVPRYLDVDRLVDWLSARQYAPEGGLSGRTNKLVDACYSHWVGGCWPLLESVLFSRSGQRFTQSPETSMFSREGLIRYLLCCCQSDDGGLRDKPGKYPDAYHCCYPLAGLSAVQHYSSYNYPTDLEGLIAPSAFGWAKMTDDEIDWIGRPEDDESKISGDIVQAIHPVFVIPYDAVEFAKEKFRGAAWK